MATVADLRARPHATYCHLLLIDGCPFGFTDNQVLCSGWWDVDNRRILPGLTAPNVTMSLDLEAGTLNDDRLSFRILDTDEVTLPGFFGGLNKAYKLLGTRLKPGEDPAPANTIDSYGNVLPLWDGTNGCYIGTEAIGPEGQRHYYSCIPWSTTWPGQDHAAPAEPLPVYTDWATGPLLVEGRRVVLYRIYFDEDLNVWPSPQEQYEGGARFWWGTLLNSGNVDKKVWTIACVGPSSWTKKLQNTRTPTTWFRVQAPLELGLQEDQIYVLCQKQGVNGTVLLCGSVTTTVTAGDYTTVLNSVSTTISTAISAAGPDGIWNMSAPVQGKFQWNHTGVKIWQTVANVDASVYILIRLHGKVWQFLGWSPEDHLYDIAEGPYFEKDLVFPGYYYGVFSSTPAGKNPLISDGTLQWDGDGQVRTYSPSFAGGLVIVSGNNQVIQIRDVPGEPIYLESQTIRPPSTDTTIDGQNCNATRWWCFKGQLLLEGEEEATEIFQVAKCSWVDQSNLMSMSNSLDSDLAVEEFADPRTFKLNYKPLDVNLGWAGTGSGEEGGIYASPLAVWGVWSRTGPGGIATDQVGATLYRLLVSSGTAEWNPAVSDYGDLDFLAFAVWGGLTPGKNGVAVPSYPWGDYECADMGLNIPYEMVDQDGILFAQAALPSTLQQGKVCAHGPVQAEDIIAGILAPRDWSLSLAGKKYGVFRRSQPFDELDTPVSIGISDYAGVPGDPGSWEPDVNLRAVDPFDTLILNHAADPVEGATEGQVEKRYSARDQGARARLGMVERQLSAPDLPAREWWDDSANNVPVHSWSAAFQKLWEQDIAGWLSQPHRLIEGLRISRPKGQDLYPGEVIRVTIPGVPNSTGGYGYSNALARVLSVTHEAVSGTAVVDLLVQASPEQLQVWAPIARVIDGVSNPEDRYDPSTRTFTIGNWNLGEAAVNLDAFREPSWSSAGGQAKFLVLQFDGTRWAQTCSGFIESVALLGEGGTITHTTAGLSGQFLECQYAVICMAPYDDPEQAEWPKAVFPIVGPPSGLPQSKKLLK
ncbi:hypothetical protein OV203_26000 [Nannocystis sp. ILAH1]|uniref:hypothetical protein n=1 Tax=Nannocystis sp. ILAH1 TaxID=2996789 RepID=UPI00226F8508|nr:hypothetical protein [Nannocystis sp. ILAH1]MCY0990623.1 hypothetical protein [Nannocystis sp. ILAH1]